MQLCVCGGVCLCIGVRVCARPFVQRGVIHVVRDQGRDGDGGREGDGWERRRRMTQRGRQMGERERDGDRLGERETDGKEREK